MQFNGKLDYADLKDVQKSKRTKMDWVKLFVKNWYPLALVIGILYATIAGALGYLHPNWPAIGIIWVVIAAATAWSFYSVKRNTAKRLAQLNAGLPDRITLAKDGLKFDGPNGANAFFPWQSFKGWREGRRVVLVDQLEGNRSVFLPISQMAEPERMSLRQLLQSHIPPPPNG